MSITALRTAVLNAGNTPPSSFSHIGLLAELIRAWGGTPTKASINGLLVEAINAVGGSTQKSLQVYLLRDLVIALGGTPASFNIDALYAQVAGLASVPGGGAPTLDPLTLSASTIAEGSAAATVVGAIGNTTATSTLSLVDDAGGRFAISGSNLVAGATATNYEVATSHNVTVRETLAGATNTPRDTIFTINVSNVLEITLAALSLNTSTLDENSVAGTLVGTLQNKTSGSTLSITDTAGNRFALSGTNIVAGSVPTDYEAATSHNITIRETHADGNNSPRDTVLNILVNDLSEGALGAITLTKTTAAGANPMQWDSDFDAFQTWDSATSTGDKHEMRWRRVAGGAWTNEAEQPLDDELLTGGFTWPFWEAAKPLAAGFVEVQERRARYVSGVMTQQSPWSNAITDTLDALAWSPDNYFTGTEQGAYYDVSDISTLFQDTAGAVPVTASGDTVLRINDLSGNGHHLISASGQGPVYRTNGGAAGDKPYLDFDGVNDFFATAGFASKAQPHYQAVAGKLDTIVPNCQFTDGLLNGARAALIAVAGGDFYMWGGSAVDTTLNLDTADVVLAGLFNGASSKAWKDGVASAVINADTNGVTGLTVGSAYNASTWLDGRVYGLFVAFSAEPDATAKANILTWLGNLQGRTL